MHRGVINLGFLVVSTALAGCMFRRVPAPPADPCWTVNPPTSYLIQAAIFTLPDTEFRGVGDQLRSLANVPLDTTVIKDRTELVTDPATCARLWQALPPGIRGAKVAAVRIGNTYWIRSGDRATAVLDNRLRWVTAFIDQ
jgi:hypothetical protein